MTVIIAVCSWLWWSWWSCRLLCYYSTFNGESILTFFVFTVFENKKIYGVLPAATGFIALYSKMTSVFEKKSLFYITCAPFFLFFLLFDTFLYPNRDLIQPSLSSIEILLGAKSGGAMEIVSKIFSNWTSSLYFVIAGKAILQWFL